MTPNLLSDKFATALTYDPYVRTGKEEHQRRWKQVYDATTLTDDQKLLLGSFTRKTNILVMSGTWCGDCVQQCPLIARIAETKSDLIDLRFLDRDQHRDLMQQVRINAGDRVPVAILMAEDFEVCSVFGERTLSRYRALMRSKLGIACPIALGPPDQNELAETLQGWLDEIERIQWMLRLSPRLRQKYGD